MTDTATAATGATAIETGHGDGHAHASDRHYVNIAIALAVITGLEVALSYAGLPIGLEIGGLLALMAIKFVTVASQFMHLKFDDKLLSRLFYTGLLLACGVYLIALTTFRIWGNG